MASIIVIVAVLALGALAFFKIPLVQGLATIVVVLVASFVAFGYYEVVSKLLAGFVASLGPWAQVISFMLLFILVFAVLQTGVVTLLRGGISLGNLAEQIGRPLCGILIGWLVAGVVLTAMWLAPLGSNLPYERFEPRRPALDSPQGALFNADGIVTGWFGMVSRGSLAAMRKPASFRLVRAGFLDQVALCRLQEGVLRSTKDLCLKAPAKNGVWEAPVGLVDSEGKTVEAPAGRQLTVVRLGLRKGALRDAVPFTLSQVSVVCQSRGSSHAAPRGEGQAVCPLGYLVGARKLETRPLTAQMRIETDKVKESQQWIDFVVAVPRDTVPVVGRFKQNNAVLLSRAVGADEAPEASDFGDVIVRPKQEAKPAAGA